MTRILSYGIILFAAILPACTREDDGSLNPEEVFVTFWKQMDEKYVGFSERNLDWDSVYSAFRPEISPYTGEQELQELLQEIIDYVNDLHVSIQVGRSEFMVTRKHRLRTDVSRRNVNDYYFSGRFAAGSFFAGQLPDNISYISVPQFDKFPSTDSISAMLGSVSFSGGCIIDLRDNHGGSERLMTRLLSFFCTDNLITGYEKIKTGPGHNDFSGFIPVINDGRGLISPQTRKVVLINENVYSAGNVFAAFMKAVPNTIFIGTKSAGGAGYPVSTILSNNWILNSPRNKIYDHGFNYIDDGISPDIVIDREDGKEPHSDADPVIEAALEYLKANISTAGQ